MRDFNYFYERKHMHVFMYVPVGGGAEEDVVLGGFASEGASAIIKSVAIGSGTSPLENGGIVSRLARVGVRKLPTATVPVRPECLTSTLASNHTCSTFVSSLPTYHLKFFRAPCNIIHSHIKNYSRVFVILFIKLFPGYHTKTRQS